jgi:hypothetical protein
MDSLESFLKSNKPQGFTPRPYYSAEGDSLTFFFADTAYHAERIDDFLTVYLSTSSKRLIGCQVKGVPKVLELLGDFGISISDNHVQLTMIFMACMAQTHNEDAKDKYRELGKVAAESNASVELPVVA